MEFKHKIFEGLKNTPEGWRFCNCWNKEASGKGNQYHSPYTLEEVLNKGGNGVGVLLGGHSTTTINGKKYGLGAIDLDGTGSDISFQHHVGIDVSTLPRTVTVASGKKDRKQMFFWIPEENLDGLKGCKKKLDGHAHFELRIGNQYSMVAGVHPETDGYFWVNSPADTDIAIAPLTFLESWEEVSPRKIKKGFSRRIPRTKDDLIKDVARVDKYLERYYSPANNYSDYDTWLTVLMALHHLSLEWEENTGFKDKLLPSAHKWSSWMSNYDAQELEYKWDSFSKDISDEGVVTIASFFHKAKEHENWEIDKQELKKENEEKPKRKKTELLNDIFESALRGDKDSYAEDFAEMEVRFRKRAQDIHIELLGCLRNKYNKKSFEVGVVDMSKIKRLEYLLEGFCLIGEIGMLYAPFGEGKTSLACGMVRAIHKGTGFLDQATHREKADSLFIMSDGGASRFLEAVETTNLTEEMYKYTITADTSQGKKNWKCDLNGLIYLHDFLKERPNIKFIVIDSVKSMLSGTPFKYQDNEQADLIINFLREIIAEPLQVSIMLLSHNSTAGESSSGAKRWNEACGWVAQIKKVKEGEKVNDKQRKLCVWKDPRNGRRVFDYEIKDGIFVPVYNSDMKGDCFGELKQYAQQVNFATGKRVFQKKEFYAINYSVSQVDKQITAHCTDRDGVLKKKSRGVYELKSKYILLNDDSKGQKVASDWDFWKN